MMNEPKIRSLPISIEERMSFLRITALWAFSESAFGGILHALSIPLRGIFIASAAVLFISLLALFAKNKNEILKAIIIVVLIKAAVSPHTPVTAYLAVSLQGILGYLLFTTVKNYKLSALLLGLLVLFFSGMQKVVILSILFGTTLWESINIFIRQISEMIGITHQDLNYGYLLIVVYLLIHLSAGFFIGIYAGMLPIRIKHYKNIVSPIYDQSIGDEIAGKEKQKRKIWFLRPTGIFILFLSAGVILLSYVSPKLEENVATSIILMLVRSILLTIIWYSLVAPIVKKLFQRFVIKRKTQYSKDLDEIISMFPKFRIIVNTCWKNSKDKNGLRRLRYFLATSFYSLLLSS